MLIDLSELISLQGKVKSVEIPLEMDTFETGYASYRVLNKKPVSFVFKGLDDKKVQLEAEIEVTLSMPCDRCLEEVRKDIKISTSGKINLGDTDITQEEVSDEQEFVSGTYFDAEKFAYGEILVNLPMKVLCNENCKGICNRCGTNLNHGKCDCDTTVRDPRMAKALEVFNSFKEV